MAEPCPVHATVAALADLLQAGCDLDPQSRRCTEEALSLLKETAAGAGDDDRLAALDALLESIRADCRGNGCGNVVEVLQTLLSEHREVLASHLHSRNCPSGDCVKLTPAPCQMACPAGIDVPAYVGLIAQGRYEDAIEVIRRDNPFPWVCGLVCTRPCESECVRGKIDSPIAIKSLKGFAAERALKQSAFKSPAKAPDKNKKVCVVGAGPAGMSAAYYLGLKGYRVRVLEAAPRAGGMILLGIPRYRLPLEVIDREVAMIAELGVEFRFNTGFGRDVTFEQLKAQGFEAFCIAVGAHGHLRLNIPGEDDFPQSMEAIGLLRRVALGEKIKVGKRVVVIGGGNVAIDAARTCLRLGSREVVIAYRRTRAEMPADPEEIEQALEEGIRIEYLTIPVEIVAKKNVKKPAVGALQCLRAKLVQKEGSTRMFPVPIPGSEFLMTADMIIPAIGQQVERSGLELFKGLNWSRWGTIEVNPVTMETSAPEVFAAGDAVSGPASVVQAIGGGRRAADAIDRFLSGLPQPRFKPVPERRAAVECVSISAAAKQDLQRPRLPHLSPEERCSTFEAVELGFSEDTARSEAARCLRCDICRRCGDCVRICREKMGVEALKLGYLEDHGGAETDFRVTAERCIGCGACAVNCLNNAMRIEDRDGRRVLSLCGAELNRLELVACDACGTPLAPLRYLEYVRKRTAGVPRATDDRRLCEACAKREAAAHGMAPHLTKKG